MTPHLVPTAVELFTICISNSNFWSTLFQRIYLNVVTKAASVGVSQSTSVIEDKKNLLLIDACFFLKFDIKQQNWSPIWMVMILHGDIIQIQHLQMLVSDFIAVQIENVCFSPTTQEKISSQIAYCFMTSMW